MVICHNCKGNGYVRLRFEGETSTVQCKVCHSSGETIHNLGMTEMETQPFIMGQRWTQTDLKTTKFIPSKPIIEFEGEPPF